jgi:hypothetical protein
MVATTKAIILAWWGSKTCVSPNQKGIVKKRQGPHLYEEKPTQYLMETQVLFKSSQFFCVVSISLLISTCLNFSHEL